MLLVESMVLQREWAQEKGIEFLTFMHKIGNFWASSSLSIV